MVLNRNYHDAKICAGLTSSSQFLSSVNWAAIFVVTIYAKVAIGGNQLAVALVELTVTLVLRLDFNYLGTRDNISTCRPIIALIDWITKGNIFPVKTENKRPT